MRKSLAALAVIFIAAHAASLPPTLGDLDSINFALGVREFDVARHQPHPPGYPVFIALGKLSTPAFATLDVAAVEPRGLAFWSVLAGGLLVPTLFLLFRALDGSERRAWWATVLTVTSPLVWFTALRPLSDVTGLTAAIVAQALLVRAITEPRPPGPPAPRNLLLGAFAAGLAIGVRSQTFLLTLPLLTLALITRRTTASAGTRIGALAAFTAGVLCWAVPLVLASGGLPAYLAALGQQGGEDFSGVVMFWNFPTLRVGLSALWHTFVSPWASAVLAIALLAAASAGIITVARPTGAWIVPAVLWVPYAIFHMLFHETLTVRYALPLVPAVAWLAVRAVDRAASAAVPVAVSLAAFCGLWLAVPAGVQYGASPAPVFRALDDLASARRTQPVTVASHRRIFTESRRARMWRGEPPGSWLEAPRDFEWLQLTRAWRDGAGPAWFFAEPRRTDLALIDAEGARVVQYRWPFENDVLVGGARPDEFDVHVYTRPGWFLEEGWALTPEVAGISEREGWSPNLKPSVGWIRRRPDPVDLVLGGRHLGGPDEPPVRVVATIDGRTVFEHQVQPGFFHGHVSLAAGSLAGAGSFAPLLVRAGPEGGEPMSRVSLEQFNLQSAGVPMLAFADGWYEPEYQPRTGLKWRWMSDRAVLWVRPVGREVTLRITAESPLRYFDRPSALRVTVGGQVAGQLAPSDDFTWDIKLSDASLSAHEGRVVLESDQWFAPGGRSGTGDQRHLAVRIYSVAVE
ncbi:MAG TPA: DUF2723 domain-containing protein [Vicinamibacterales bacterium]|nr:DUF2723 domain-containing protein [Vicinamibacterales bacterium]